MHSLQLIMQQTIYNWIDSIAFVSWPPCEDDLRHGMLRKCSAMAYMSRLASKKIYGRQPDHHSSYNAPAAVCMSAASSAFEPASVII